VNNATRLLVAYLAVLLALTFLPLDGLDRSTPVEVRLHAFATIKYALRLGITSGQFWVLIGNVVAFVPFGFLLPLAIRRSNPFVVIAAGIALSFGIELGQLAISIALRFGYRAADIDDVIVNVVGLALGYAIFLIFTLGRPRPSTPRSAGRASQ
jgi:glycopeptide antibiotics resistance protein